MKNYKKVLLIGFFSFVFLIIAGFVTIYILAREPISREKTEAIQIAKSEAKITEIIETNWFHYIDSYMVVEGKMEDGTYTIVFVPDSDEEELVIVKKDEGISLDEAVHLLANELDISSDKRPREIIDGKFGLIDRLPVYEITYIDQKGRHSIIYIDFYEGEWFRVFNL